MLEKKKENHLPCFEEFLIVANCGEGWAGYSRSCVESMRVGINLPICSCTPELQQICNVDNAKWWWEETEWSHWHKYHNFLPRTAWDSRVWVMATCSPFSIMGHPSFPEMSNTGNSGVMVRTQERKPRNAFVVVGVSSQLCQPPSLH